MMKFRTIMTAALALTMVAGTVSAQQMLGDDKNKDRRRNNSRNQKLEVGSDAPPITISEWVKGDPVEEFEEGHAYVVEFWATWCGPCIKNMPHLTKLQEAYQDSVTFIGVSDEKANVVRPFVAKNEMRMGYTVAVDDRSKTNNAYMKAAGQTGIPAAFIVDGNGKIAFIGHPAEPEFEEILAKVADGRYDPKLEEAAQPLMRQVEYSRKMEDWPVCERYLDEIIDLDPYIFNNVAIKKFRILLMDKKNTDEAIAYVKNELMLKYADDGETMSELAELILTDAEILRTDEARLKPLALELATAGVTKDEVHVDQMRILGMALHRNGNTEEAIRVQEKAYFMADPSLKPEFKRILDSYHREVGGKGRAGIRGRRR